MRARFLVLVLGLSVSLPSTPCRGQAEPAIESLFNGRDLDGWEGDAEYWRVENGAIVGEIPPGRTLRKNTWLVWRGGELADFDLSLRFRLTGAPAANSGIQVRCQVRDVDHVSGYQADLDMGATWLGRIYDEHGRALLVERGTRVSIEPDGRRHAETFADAADYAVLFREQAWNDYRIVAIGDRMAVYVNGTLFSELRDRQTNERDPSGGLAFQLHSGPETRIEFRDIRVEKLDGRDGRLEPFSIGAPAPESAERSIRNPVLHHLVPNPAPIAPNQPGRGTVSRMFVPRGFSVDVIAAEPDVHQPMAFAFDARGRLWVVEGHCYPQKRPVGEGLDRIVIFADQEGDGRFESRKVFIEGLNLVSGMEVGFGGVWVGAAPELLFIPDRNGDDQPDSEPEVLLDGFGYADTHETLNNFLWGPDGWLYGNQGVFNQSRIGIPGAPEGERQSLQAGVWRFHPTRRAFEVFSHGGSNQWGLDYDEYGQLFMTHCRSFWGQGLTTHVMQGGHYWNQVNGGYAPFISSTPLPDRPAMKNYLLASARYGHGEGGAGKPGSNAVFGGHSHVGTMIYLGDNWPAEFRNHLFTHNLHGHQLNHQVNLREAGGYNTVHAGRDMLFCADPRYIGVDLQTGPDGAVYINDWYDPRLCHNPNIEHWDRGNGRIYRMKYDAAYRPETVDYARATDEELVAAQSHRNDWHVRTARLVLGERAARQAIAPEAVRQLREMATRHPNDDRRLRALWALHAVHAIDAPLVNAVLADESEYVRGWAVQLAVESLPPAEIADTLTEAARRDASLFVRRYLASAIQRVPADLGWTLAEILCSQPENASDRDLPSLIWFGVARWMEGDLERALRLADMSRLSAVRDDIHWYAAKLSPEGRNAIGRRLAAAEKDERFRLLSLFESAIRGMRSVPQPEGWQTVASGLYESSDAPTRRAAESVGAAFGDGALFARMRRLVADNSASLEDKEHAVAILAYDPSPENLSHYLGLLDDERLAGQVVPLLGSFNHPSVGDALIARLSNWKGTLNAAAMEVLSSRAPWSEQLLDAIDAGRIDKKVLTAYYARQMAHLGNTRLGERLATQWGAFSATSDAFREEISKTVAAYQSAPLWAYSVTAGSGHFQNLCAACHLPDGTNESLGPNLAGTGAKGIGYIVENIVDPHAVIGRAYQARVVATDDGRVTTGLIEEETETAITIRTQTNRVVLPRDVIEAVRVSSQSFMPSGLLDRLNDRERLELLKYLMSL
ncbi:MAG: DUF1080 domain-containing protein [Planctomycetes bacterium]|nr:DUF1080 domain-containing protein [Planctomycetota bacterium]